MLTVKFAHASAEDVYTMCEALMGWDAFVENEVAVTEGDNGTGCYLVVGPENDHDAYMEADLC